MDFHKKRGPCQRLPWARLFLKTPKHVDFLSTAFAPMPLAPDLQNTRRARMTRRPEAECRDETTCLRTNALTGHDVSPDTTRQKARHSKRNHSEHLNQPQPTRNVRQTDATQSHCCGTTRSAPIGTPLTPREGPGRRTVTPLARDKQHIRHPTVCSCVVPICKSCVSATNAMIDDELAKKTTFGSKKTKTKDFWGTLAPRWNSNSTPSRAFNSTDNGTPAYGTRQKDYIHNVSRL